MLSERHPRTNAQWLDFFGQQFGGAYKVSPPATFGGKWSAVALLGQRDELSEWSPAELLEELIHHRHRKYHKPEGHE